MGKWELGMDTWENGNWEWKHGRIGTGYEYMGMGKQVWEYGNMREWELGMDTVCKYMYHCWGVLGWKP